MAKDPEARPDMDTIVGELEALGAYRTRRVSPLRANAAAANADRPKSKTRQGGVTTTGGLGQTLNSANGRRFMVAISIAILLVVASAVLLFSEAGGPPANSAPEVVQWQVDSDPAGALLVRADNNEVLGTTPFRRSESRRVGGLRVNLRLPGYRDTTVILNYAQSTRQKIPLEPKPTELPPPVPTAAEAAAKAAPAAVTGRVRLTLSSDPRGAEVFRDGSAQSLGKTPLKLDEELRGAPLKLFVRLEGFQEASVLLDPSSGARQSVSLQRLRGGKPRKKPGDAPTATPGEAPAAVEEQIPSATP